MSWLDASGAGGCCAKWINYLVARTMQERDERKEEKRKRKEEEEEEEKAVVKGQRFIWLVGELEIQTKRSQGKITLLPYQAS
jgi:hypothetical protein